MKKEIYSMAAKRRCRYKAVNNKKTGIECTQIVILRIEEK